MEIKKFTKLKKNKYKLSIDNGLDITLYDDVIVKYNLLSNKVISNSILDEITSYNDKMGAYYEGLSYISKRLRTKKELINYLSKKYERQFVLDAIDKLSNEGYLNDEVYVECFINDQINLSINGPDKIKKKLLELGYREEVIDNKLSKIDISIFDERLKKLIEKKVRLNHKLSKVKLKEKIIYDLVNVGYRKDTIEKYLDIDDISDNDILEKEYIKIYKKLEKKYQGKELELQLINKLMQKGFSYNDIKQIKSAHDL